MSYKTQVMIAQDTDLANRITAAAASEHIDNPWGWQAERVWVWAAQPGWGEAYASALAAHPDDPEYRPGWDEAVITDGMILSAVQAEKALDTGGDEEGGEA